MSSLTLQLDKKSFKLLLPYLEGLRGNQHNRVMEGARHMLEQYKPEDEEGMVEKRVSKYQYRRASEVLRTLA